jgi:hypothetical protein
MLVGPMKNFLVEPSRSFVRRGFRLVQDFTSVTVPVDRRIKASVDLQRMAIQADLDTRRRQQSWQESKFQGGKASGMDEDSKRARDQECIKKWTADGPGRYLGRWSNKALL